MITPFLYPSDDTFLQRDSPKENTGIENIRRIDGAEKDLEEKKYSEAIPHGSEKVMVVEDEEAVRRLAVQILKK